MANLVSLSQPSIACSWPPCKSRSNRNGHETCSILHFNFLMSAKLDPSFLLFFVNQSQHSSVCALKGCEATAHLGHDFCTKSHALAYLSNYLQELRRQNRLCKMAGCIRHVFVEINDETEAIAKIHQFCGWKHAKLYALYKEMAIQELSLTSRIEALKRWVLEKRETTGISVDEDFLAKHPSPILTHPDGCSKHVIAKCKFKGDHEREKVMKTIDGIDWKQQQLAGKDVQGLEVMTVGDCKVSKRHLTCSLPRSEKIQSRGEIESNDSSFVDLEIPGRQEHPTAFTISEYKIVEDSMDDVFKQWCLLDISPMCIVGDEKRGTSKTRALHEGHDDVQ